MSETTATTVMTPITVNVFGNIGLLCPQMDLRTAAIKHLSRDVELGEEGEIWVKGNTGKVQRKDLVEAEKKNTEGLKPSVFSMPK